MGADRIRTEEVETLLRVLAGLDDPDRIYALLEDLCTPREITDMSQRLQVAGLLASGVHYTEISKRTGASATTISRVSKCLNYGADGYRSVIEEGKLSLKDGSPEHDDDISPGMDGSPPDTDPSDPVG